MAGDRDPPPEVSVALPMSRHGSRRETAALLLALAPACLVAVLIARYAVNVPYWDSWEWAVERYARNDGFAWSDYWTLRNEHRLLIPLLADTLIAEATGLDMVARVWVKLPAALAILAMIGGMYRSRARSPHAYLIALPFSLLVFSVTYWPMWMDPRPLGSHLAILGMLAAVWAITALPRGWSGLGVAAVMACMSSLSFAAGNATWVVVGALLWAVGYRRPRHYVVWAALSGAVLLPYALDLADLSRAPGELSGAPGDAIVRFTLNFIGASVSGADGEAYRLSAAAMGLLGIGVGALLLAGVFRFVEDGGRKALPWAAIIGWVVTSGMMAAYGRAALGSTSAQVPRYSHFGSLFWIGIVALIALALTEPRRAASDDRLVWLTVMRVIPVGASLLIALGFITASQRVLSSPRFGDHSALLATGRDCLLEYTTANDACLGLLHPDVAHIRRLMPLLQDRDAAFLSRPRALPR